jgi:hypothetical protein
MLSVLVPCGASPRSVSSSRPPEAALRLVANAAGGRFVARLAGRGAAVGADPVKDDVHLIASKTMVCRGVDQDA